MVDDDGEDGDDDQEADDHDSSTRHRSRSAKRSRKSMPESSLSDEVQVLIRGPGMEDETVGPLRSERQRLKKLQQEQEQQRKLQEEQDSQSQQMHGADKLRQNRNNTSNEDISMLRTNPNISMRELFPGEEDLGLNVQVPFGSASSWRTPDGWTKVNTIIQYDEPTRRLWEELQKPYGNQSSFMRHLILLEKYFRNGDLVLSSTANSGVVTYAESVQNRLRSYDNNVSGTKPSPLAELLSKANTTITSFPRQLNSSVTIMQTTKSSLPSTSSLSKQPTTSTPISAVLEPTSLLKTNRTPAYTITTEPIIKPTTTTSAPKSIPKTSIGSPPELISINSADNNKQSSQQMYVAQMQLTRQKQIQAQQKLQQQQQQPQASTSSVASGSAKKPSASNKEVNASTSNSNQSIEVIRLPETLTEAELQDENWRPNLMPFSTREKPTGNEVYLTADGRRLPGLVQVQSQGRPFVISIHDYNRLCIVRREKNLHKDKNKSVNASIVASVAPTLSASTMTAQTLAAVSALTPASTTIELERPKPASNAANLATGSNTTATILNIPQRKVQIPNKILEQNSLIPLPSMKQLNQSDDSLLKSRKNPTSLLKSNANVTNMNRTNIMPQISVTSAVNNRIPSSLASALASTDAVSIISTPSISSILALSGGTPTSTPPPMQNPSPITITSVNSLHDVVNTAAIQEIFRNSHQLPPHQSVWQWAESLSKNGVLNERTPIDNSATSILSKIPKSLTVIPQKRLSSKGDDL